MAFSNLVTEVTYNGNGAATDFPITFEYYEDDQVTAKLVNTSDDSETVLVNPTDFTVVAGDVVMGTAPAIGFNLVITRKTELTQNTNYQASGPFLADDHEFAIDKLTMIVQELEARIAKLEA